MHNIEQANNVSHHIPFYVFVQVKNNPPAGTKKQTFLTVWKDSIRRCERALLEAQIQYALTQMKEFERLAHEAKAELLKELGPDLVSASEAEAAAEVCANYHKNREYLKQTKWWNIALNLQEQNRLGIKHNRRRPAPRASQSDSGANRGPQQPPRAQRPYNFTRVLKTAKRRLPQNAGRPGRQPRQGQSNSNNNRDPTAEEMARAFQYAFSFK